MTDPLELVIFDCDGVLVDSEPISNGVLAQMLGELGWHLTLQQTVERFMGRSLAQCVQGIEQHFGRPLPVDFLATLAERTQVALQGQLKAVAGIEALLDGLTVPRLILAGAHAVLTRMSQLPALLWPPGASDALMAADARTDPNQKGSP